MALLTTQTIALAGLEPSYAAAAEAGDTYTDDGSNRIFVHAKNGSGGPITVTIASQVTPAASSGTAAANLAVVVPAGEERMVGPVPRPFVAASTNLVAMTYSSHTSLTVGVFKLGA